MLEFMPLGENLVPEENIFLVHVSKVWYIRGLFTHSLKGNIMAKFNYSKLLDSGSLSASFNEEVDRQTAAGRVPHFFITAVNAKYGFAIPEKKTEFLKFRTTHVAYAGMSKEERAKQDEAPALWVKGHILRSDLFGAMDGIAAGLTKSESMPDTADWLTLFAPAKPAPKPAAKPAAASVEPARLGTSTATFPALGPAPKSSPAGAAAGAAIDPGFGSHPMTQIEMAEALAAQLKAGLVPESIWLMLVQAHNAGKIKAIVKAPAPAPAPAQAELTVDDTATL